MTILSAQATRRDVKSYFGRFGKPSPKLPTSNKRRTMPSVDNAPVRTALIKLCQADALSNIDLLPGLAKTLVQLGKLGMPSCLVIEPRDGYRLPISNPISLRERLAELAYRVVDTIESQGGRAQPLVGDLLTKDDSPMDHSPRDPNQSNSFTQKLELTIDDRSINFPLSSMDLVHKLLLRNTIPVIVPLAGGLNPSISPISGDATMYRVCAEVSKNPDFAQTLSIERIIIIDPIGGLPSQSRRGGSHLYINLQQEYTGIVDDLSAKLNSAGDVRQSETLRFHLRNIVVANMCLRVLGSTSSALITTPKIAASQASQSSPQSLIHNLLTDKPLISPSLPWRRSTTPISETTLLRLGLPVVVYRSLDDRDNASRALDFSRLVQLIEDSFGRRLAIDAYKSRIQDKIAAIIIAGDYEGAAIVTNESAPGSTRCIPYLDKFAVSSNSQGSKGVADIVFNVLTSLFPEELFWRSRKSNPVNKWVDPLA